MWHFAETRSPSQFINQRVRCKESFFVHAHFVLDARDVVTPPSIISDDLCAVHKFVRRDLNSFHVLICTVCFVKVLSFYTKHFFGILPAVLYFRIQVA